MRESCAFGGPKNPIKSRQTPKTVENHSRAKEETKTAHTFKNYRKNTHTDPTKKRYKNLKGARVNITYYPDVENVAGVEFEVMKVVRLRTS